MSQQLIKQLREQRMRWVDVAPGKRVRIIRPTEIEVSQHFFKDGTVSVGFEEVKRFCVDWSGFTGADILGPAVGSGDPIVFDGALWGEVLGDHAAWVRQLAEALLDSAVQHRAATEDDAKNS